MFACMMILSKLFRIYIFHHFMFSHIVAKKIGICHTCFFFFNIINFNSNFYSYLKKLIENTCTYLYMYMYASLNVRSWNQKYNFHVQEEGVYFKLLQTELVKHKYFIFLIMHESAVKKCKVYYFYGLHAKCSQDQVWCL